MSAFSRRPERVRALPLPFLIVATLAATAAAAQDRAGAPRGVRVIGRETPTTQAPDREQESRGGAASVPASPSLKNSAGLTFDILPGTSVPVGSKLSFRIGASRSGYVVIVDVDASGKTTQIYPTALAGAMESGRSDAINRIAGGTTLVIPPSNSTLYEFVASPPSGVGMTMAIFSEAPLQVIDLPDVPAALLGRADEATFLRDAAKELRFLPTDEGADLKSPDLSFAARFYAVR